MATCGDCRFGGGIEKLVDGDLRCRQKPPSVMTGSGIETRWPIVRASDWCGYHQPRTPAIGNPIDTLIPVMTPFLAVAEAMEAEGGDMLLPTDLADPEGEPLTLSSDQFLALAAAWARARGV